MWRRPRSRGSRPWSAWSDWSGVVLGPLLARIPLVLGVVLLLGGIYVKLEVAEQDGLGLIVIGSILIGVWLTQTVADWADGRRKSGKGGDGDGDG